LSSKHPCFFFPSAEGFGNNKIGFILSIAAFGLI
jgi:hypothetical protein